MPHFRFAVFIFAILPLELSAQGDVTLAGRVVNAITGEPVVRASVDCVVLAKPSPSEIQAIRNENTTNRQFTPRMPSAKRVFTDVSGTFRCEGMISGIARINVSRPQFSPGIEAGEVSGSKQDYTIRLVPFSAIEGTVTDEDGAPKSGIGIMLFTVTVEDGRKHIRENRSVSTNEFGKYRLWNLPQGKYLLRAAERNLSTLISTGPSSRTDGPADAPVPVYYGGGTTRSAATPLQLTAGQDLTADFVVKSQPVQRVRGTLTGQALQQNVKFELLTADGDVVPTRAQLNGGNGKFLLYDVFPGTYKLRVTQSGGVERLAGDTLIEVKGQDLDNVNVTLFPPIQVNTRLTCAPVAANAAQQTAITGVDGVSRMRAVRGCFASVGLVASDAETVMQGIREGAHTVPVPAGRYSVAMIPNGTQSASVRWQGRELGVDDVVELQPGASAPTLEVDLRNVDFGTVTFTGLPQKPATQIVLIPNIPTLNGPFTFQTEGKSDLPATLPAGDYNLFVFPREADVEYRNPQILRQFSGIPVHVEKDSTQKIEVKGVSR